MTIRQIIFVAALGAAPVAAAPSANPAVPLLDQGYRQMYNRQFAEAHRTFEEYQRLHPDDALGPVSDAAAYLFSEFDRLHILQSEFFTHDQHFMTDHKLQPDPEVRRKFEAALDAGRAIARRTPGDDNAAFASILISGLHSDYLALIDKRYGASLQEMKAGRQMAERLLARNPNYCDAWIAVGVENYMLSIKPAPVRFLLRLGGGKTDRAVGLEKLRVTAAKGRYLAPFARLLLAVAAIRENDRTTAHSLLSALAAEFPQNPLYTQELTRLDNVTR
ncbi:MAG: hypothetical protein JWP63_98 [Candidatus Solibacter sp.]|nr:hypothetical protein [Candidatus Solibacter sp.]